MSNSDKRGEMMRKTYTKQEIITFLKTCYEENGDFLSLKLSVKNNINPRTQPFEKSLGHGILL